MKKFLALILTSILFLSSCGYENVIPGKSSSGSSSITSSASSSITSSSTSSSSSMSSSAANPVFRVSDFFPFTSDVHMVYKGSGNEFAEYQTFVEYIRGNRIQIRTINPGAEISQVYEVSGGMLREVFQAGDIGYRMDFTQKSGESNVLIKEPIQVGTQWTMSDGSISKITAVDKSIDTPLSKYKALEITTTGKDSITYDYYVSGIGHVKRVFTTKNSIDAITSEIEKIEKNVPYRHSVRFYFPEFNKDRLVYIDRVVEISTNQDMKYKFQKELKTIPSGSGLTKVLTSGVQVLSCRVDKGKGIAYVDFSSELVNEMNAGTTLESMILKCITNTFGHYYDVNKVIITVGGKPYSSGHILLKAGEYMKVDTSGIVEYK